MQMHVIVCNRMKLRDCHGPAPEADQPQALSLCPARGDRADREGCRLQADRYRSRQQTGLVCRDFSARQDAGAAGRRPRDFRIRRHPGVSRENPAETAAPADALSRAEHRAWIEFGSAVLNDIAGFYASPDETAFKAKTSQLQQRFARLEARVAASPWFDGESFSLVDAVFGPVFRYFDVFDEIADFGI